MRELDVGRFMRLRNAIQQASEAASDLPSRSAVALAEAYERFRQDAYDLIPEEHRAELDRICPTMDQERIARAEGLASSYQGEVYSEAKVLLGSLSGFLDGYIEETRDRMAAEERARLAAEQGGQYL